MSLLSLNRVLIRAMLVLFAGWVIAPAAARASICDDSTYSNPALVCGDPVRDAGVASRDPQRSGAVNPSVGGLSDENNYCGLGGSSYDEDVVRVRCQRSGPVRLTLLGQNCDLDLFLARDCPADSGCQAGVVRAERVDESFVFQCQAGVDYIAALEPEPRDCCNGAVVFGTCLGWRGDCLTGSCGMFADHNYTVRASCIEDGSGTTCSDGYDNDGDGAADCADAGCPQASCVENCTDGIDNDRDSLADCADPDCSAQVTCCDRDNDGVRANTATCSWGGDCNDTNPAVKPGATEAMNDGLDANCDGAELCPNDNDRDGYGSPLQTRTVTGVDCNRPDLSAANDTQDCDDTLSSVNPAAAEVTANGRDENCDGLHACWNDSDGDDYGTPSTVNSSDAACRAGTAAPQQGDCNDGAATVNPAASEQPANRSDDNCDGLETCWVDDDLDDYGTTVQRSSADLGCTSGSVAPVGGDCNDGDSTRNPGATEVVANSKDENCDFLERCYVDGDADGWGGTSTTTSATLSCVGPGIAARTGDCQDNNNAVSPGTSEVPVDGRDSNCDGLESCYVDADRDTYGSASVTSSSTLSCIATGVANNANDCNDTDAAIRPGAIDPPETATDENCDGVKQCYQDSDRDGVGSSVVVNSPSSTCAVPGYSDRSNDCDDRDAARYPGATEIPNNGRDEDCNAKEICPTDGDADGWAGTGYAETGVISCVAPGFANRAGDCNDSDATIRPDAAEGAADGRDQNCDGQELCFVDADTDGYGVRTTALSAALNCSQAGFSARNDDCNDLAGAGFAIHPDALEIPNNGVDEDCNGGEICFIDADRDTYGSANVGPVSGLSCAVSGFATNSLDCNDGSASIYPGAVERVANGVDEDCDLLEVCYRDADADSFGSTLTATSALLTCRDVGVSPNDDDCNDNDGAIRPGATETFADAVDQNCDGYEYCFPDSDGDGYGRAPATPTTSITCSAAGWSTRSDDCLDVGSGASLRHPGAVEVPGDGIDQDCDGSESCHPDADGDGYGSDQLISGQDFACSAPNVALSAGDCDDTPGAGATINPGAPEAPGDGIDQDCNGVDNCYRDRDGDGVGGTQVLVGSDLVCGGANQSPRTGDCLDQGEATAAAPFTGSVPAISVSPLAIEVCDGVDNDCDGRLDDADDAPIGMEAFYADDDQDGFGRTADMVTACVQPPGTSLQSGDCDDLAQAIHPGAGELCDGTDNDCDGLLDVADPEVTGTSTFYADFDGDGFGDEARPTVACGLPEAHSVNATDCDDTSSLRWPGNVETPYDGIDQDCSGDDVSDADGDGYASVHAVGGNDCNDADPRVHPTATERPNGMDDDCDGLTDGGTTWSDDDADGFAEVGGDCDDANPDRSPATAEVRDCDGIDQDCDGDVDEGTSCGDDDRDGFSEAAGDCNDHAAEVYPGRGEVQANGVDDDCDGVVDDGTADADHDGYADFAGDCDDHDPSRGPAAVEVANGIDDDCDGLTDEGTPAADDDGDGYSELAGDCDDTRGSLAPNLADVPNGVDDDCDGVVDEGGAQIDDDGDGWSDASGDCDDRNPALNPGATDLPDGVDNDCDGSIDDRDEDADGDGFTTEQGDCDDSDGWRNPQWAEVCGDLTDNDCDGVVDDGCTEVDELPIEGEDDPPSDGCGCSASGVGGGAAWILALAAAVTRRRRAA